MALFHCVVDWIDKWQGILSGLLGFAAAIWVVWYTLRIENRKDEKELVSLKCALAAEIMQLAFRTFSAHKRFNEIAKPGDGITMHALASLTRSQEPVIYPQNANQIGKLGDLANDIVLFYFRVREIEETLQRMRLRMEDEREINMKTAEITGKTASQKASLIRRMVGAINPTLQPPLRLRSTSGGGYDSNLMTIRYRTGGAICIDCLSSTKILNYRLVGSLLTFCEIGHDETIARCSNCI